MRRSIEKNPDLLTYRLDEGKGGQVLGAFLLIVGIAALTGGLRHSDDFSGSMGVLIGGFLTIGGVFNLLSYGITFDRRKHLLIDWWRVLRVGQHMAESLHRYDRVAITRGGRYNRRIGAVCWVYPVALLGPDGARRTLENCTGDPAVSRALAEEIGRHLGLAVVDCPEDNLSSPVVWQ